jgi:hypothetical protein
MPVRRLVVERHALLHRAGQSLRVERSTTLRHRREHLFQHVEEIAAIAIRHADHGVPRGCVRRQRPPLEDFRSPDQRLHRLGVEPVQHQNLRAGEKRPIQLEARIFRRGADENDRSVLHIGKKGILLGLVEAVDLVHEQERAAPLLPPDPRLLEHFLEVGHTGENGGDLLEGQSRLARKQPGDRRLARAGRPPQDDGRYAARGQHPRDHAVGAHEVVLSHDVGQLLRAQPVRQRAGCVLAHACRLEQAGHHPPTAIFMMRPPRSMAMRHSRASLSSTVRRPPHSRSPRR